MDEISGKENGSPQVLHSVKPTIVILRGHLASLSDGSWIVPGYGAFSGYATGEVVDHRFPRHRLEVFGPGLPARTESGDDEPHGGNAAARQSRR